MPVRLRITSWILAVAAVACLAFTLILRGHSDSFRAVQTTAKPVDSSQRAITQVHAEYSPTEESTNGANDRTNSNLRSDLNSLLRLFASLDDHLKTVRTSVGDVRVPDDAARMHLEQLLRSIIRLCTSDPSAVQAVMEMLERRDSDLRFRAQCCVILAALGREEHLDRISEFIATYQDSPAVLPAIYSLGQRHPIQGTPTWYSAEEGVLVFPIGEVKGAKVVSFLLGLAKNLGYSLDARDVALSALGASLQDDLVLTEFVRLAEGAQEPSIRAHTVRQIGESASSLSVGQRNKATDCLAAQIVADRDDHVRFGCWESLLALGTDKALSVALDFAHQSHGSLRRCQSLSTLANREVQLSSSMGQLVLKYAGDWLVGTTDFLEFAQLSGKVALLLRKKPFTPEVMKTLEERLVILQQTEADDLRKREYGQLLESIQNARAEHQPQ